MYELGFEILELADWPRLEGLIQAERAR
jgi:hypothetical protein